MVWKRVLALVLLLPFFTLAYTSPGNPTGHVNDFAGMLSQEAVSALESKLRTYTDESGVEIAVVTIPNLPSDETIETYAVELFEEWGIGKAKEDNGLLLLISRDDREVRIEVGYGLEPEVTDIESAYIIRETIVPAFQAGRYDEGVSRAVDQIVESVSTESIANSEPRFDTGNFIGQFGYILLFLLMFLASILARSRSWWAGGIIGAIIGLVFFSGLFAVGIFALIGLVLDFIVSRQYQRSKRDHTDPPWWIGGGGFGGGRRFGGFGGGGSGGGGASGDW